MNKPTIKAVADYFIASFPGCERTAEIDRHEDMPGAYRVRVPGTNRSSVAYNDVNAMRNAWVMCTDAPEALTLAQVVKAVRKFIDTADLDMDGIIGALACLDYKTRGKALRALLKARLGFAVSVKASGGHLFWYGVTARKSSPDKVRDSVMLTKIFGGVYQEAYQENHYCTDGRGCFKQIIG